MILQVSTPGAEIQVKTTHVKLPAYEQDGLAKTLKGNFAPYIVLPLIIIYLRMTYGMLYEKEKKIKEGMKIMGMHDSSFYYSWIIYYEIIYLITSLLVCLILKGTVFAHSNFLLVLISHQLFCWSLIAQSMFIQVFFTRAKIGNIIAMVWFLVMYMTSFFINSGDIPTSVRRQGSLSSHTALSFAADTYLLVETDGYGISFNNASDLVNKYSVSIQIYMTILNIIVFLVLAFYLDQVFPNEWGHKRHPLFFLECFFKRNKKSQQAQQLIDDREAQGHAHANVEEVGADLRKLEKEGNALKVSGLSKVYPSGKRAVTDLSLTMFQDQIFVLLGHNGAGKTSTISMLTGMLTFT